MSRETYARERFIDKVTPAREFRGVIQGAWVALATREWPDVTYGWQVNTCIDRYDDLNAFGRFGVRTAPTFVGVALALFVSRLPIQAPPGGSPLWYGVGYLLAIWLAVTFYDAVVGFYNSAIRGGHIERRVAVGSLAVVLLGITLVAASPVVIVEEPSNGGAPDCSVIPDGAPTAELGAYRVAVADEPARDHCTVTFGREVAG